MSPNVVIFSPHESQNAYPGHFYQLKNAIEFFAWSSNPNNKSDLRGCGRLFKRKTVVLILAIHTICLLVFTARTSNLFSFGTEIVTRVLNNSVIYEGYCVLPNIYHSSQINDTIRITQILHISSNFLDDRIIDQVKNWQAPVSLSVVLIRRDDYYCMKTMLSQLIKDNPEVSSFLSVHFIFPIEWNLNCVAPTQTSKCEKQKYTENIMANYPANIARNVARMFSTTKYILIADFEHLFSAGFEQDVKKVADRWLDHPDARHVLVYRIFEIETKVPEPKTITDLKELYDKDAAVVFHNKFYKGAHDIPGLDEWFKENGTDLGISTQAVKYNRFSWEPQFVSRNDIPFHDVHFPFLIRDNTCLRWELCRAGYKFDVLSRHFMYHRGIKRKRGITLSYKNALKNQQKFKKALIAFKKRMDDTYTNSKGKCPEPRS